MKKIACIALMAFSLLACKEAAPEKAPVQGGAKPPKKNLVVVVVDLEKVVKEAKLSQEIQADLGIWSENMRRDIQAKADLLKRKDGEFRAQAARMSPDQRAARIQELDSMQQELQQLQNQAQQELERRRGIAGQRMTEKFEPLVQKLAKENGWDVVLNRSEQITIFSNDALDQTDFVIKRLNEMPQEKPADASAPPPAGQVPNLPGK